MNAESSTVPTEQIELAVQAALLEDAPFGDATCAALFRAPVSATGTIRAKQPAVIAGIAIALETFRQVDPLLSITAHVDDGAAVQPGDPLLTAEGDARAILRAERIALNFLQQLSGVATLTARFCEAVRGYPVKILDTRKTVPGLRALQKWAVRLGGGVNHRFSLSDGIMIKDNHLLLAQGQGLSVTDCARLARSQGRPGLRIIVEIDRLDQVPLAVEGDADVILLDNMTPAEVRQAVQLIKGRAQVEVSGGITLATIQEYAAAGPDFISVGALTHSAPSVDLSLDFIPADPAP